MGAPAEPRSPATIGSTLTVHHGGPMIARVKQQSLAFLLNIASGKLLTSAEGTADGGTASQVLQDVADLLNDGDASNGELAIDLSETINNAQIIASGPVPIGEYDAIAYARRQFANLRLLVAPNPGRRVTRVFSFAMPVAGEAVLEIYDLNGRLVATPLAGFAEAGDLRIAWPGTSADGRLVAEGVYFARPSLLRTADPRKVHRFYGNDLSRVSPPALSP